MGVQLWSAPKRNGECFFMSSVDKQTRRETVQVIADYIVEALYDLLASKGASGACMPSHALACLAMRLLHQCMCGAARLPVADCWLSRT